MVSLLLGVLLTLLEPFMTSSKTQLLQSNIEILGKFYFGFQVFKCFSFHHFHALRVSQRIHMKREWYNLISNNSTPPRVSSFPPPQHFLCTVC